jgi:hypothetical protein
MWEPLYPTPIQTYRAHRNLFCVFTVTPRASSSVKRRAHSTLAYRGPVVLFFNKRFSLHTDYIQRRATARWEVLRDAFGQGRAKRGYHIHHALLISEAGGMAANVPMAHAGGPSARAV